MKYEELQSNCESTASKLDRITTYIDRMAVLPLPVDRNDEAKARFVSNITRRRFWEYHAKEIISATASCDQLWNPLPQV